MSERTVSQSVYRGSFVLLILVGILIAAVTPNSGRADSSSIDPMPGQLSEPDSSDGTNVMPGETAPATGVTIAEWILFLWPALL